MSNHLPWYDISIPDADYNVRLAPDCGAIPVYWGRDCDGKFLCLVSLAGDFQSRFMQEKLSVKGMHIDLRRDASQNCQNLVLTLERQVDSDLFHTLCKSLVASLRQVALPEVALSVTLQHLKRWRIFLMGQNARLLSTQEYRGLFGELCFLERLLGANLAQAYAVSAWTGPDGVQQDFIFSGRAVEVKSLSSSDRSSVRISSENQLETIEDKLYLVCFSLTESQENAMAMSLNGLVDKIAALLEDKDVLSSFEAKLADYGYIPLPDYDSPKLFIATIQAYFVCDEFPKLVRSGLPAGIAHVNYQVELDKIDSFICDLKHVLEDI
ncbi:PD-(D/E)XK motif protein [Desulfovibrio desulfuricans]|uniref:PD-(D/E)XK motif protein n=1 Tax=Desulfovibrio desulfuricans TaxID=876 RepID=UPI0035B4AC47